MLFNKYKITEHRFDEMVKAQLGRCGVCKEELKNPHVDHNHTTGVVRGLLCRRCNFWVGIVETKGEGLVLRVLLYLRAFAKPKVAA
jgi:hypothetical protein